MSETAEKRSRKGWALAFALVVVAAVGAGVLLDGHSTAQQPPAQGTPPAVPVTVGKVIRQDVPLWLRGLGTVQPFYSVQIRSKVDGTLMQVPVTEGQDVKQGDLLAVIDPKPYHAALDAATAKKAQDEADLVNARRDLARYSSLEQKAYASHQQVDTQSALVNHLIAAIAADDALISPRSSI